MLFPSWARWETLDKTFLGSIMFMSLIFLGVVVVCCCFLFLLLLYFVDFLVVFLVIINNNLFLAKKNMQTSSFSYHFCQNFSPHDSCALHFVCPCAKCSLIPLFLNCMLIGCWCFKQTFKYTSQFVCFTSLHSMYCKVLKKVFNTPNSRCMPKTVRGNDTKTVWSPSNSSSIKQNLSWRLAGMGKGVGR